MWRHPPSCHANTGNQRQLKLDGGTSDLQLNSLCQSVFFCLNVNIEHSLTPARIVYSAFIMSHYAPHILSFGKQRNWLQCPHNIVIEQDLDSCQDRGIPLVN